MHMADALVSPAVGGTMWLASAALLTYSIKKVKFEMDEKKIPLMGVMGAFVFAAQMINFTIPGTGSSGHIGGGMLLSILLGPHAGFISMASILLIQALFFADGGLLAYGCNLINLGLFTCFLAYPLIYKKIIKKGYSTKRIFLATVVSAIVGLQFGAFSVTLQTLFSGKTELPFGMFVALMQPIHLAIGIVEGFATAAVISFVYKASPELISMPEIDNKTSYRTKKLIAIFAVLTLIIGGFFSWFSSSNPDGLEWSMIHVSSQEELSSSSSIHETISRLQEKLAFLPDYGFKNKSDNTDTSTSILSENGGTSISGIVGALITLMLIAILGVFINKIKKRNKIID